MADISQVNFPDDANNPYDIADTTARSGLADKMDKTNPTGTGSFSLNRKANTTIGTNSFAEGYNTTASGQFSHAEGNGTTANHKSQHVFGEYNALDSSSAEATERGNYVEIVGNGAYNSRSNARTLDWLGNEVLSGTIEATGFGTTLDKEVDRGGVQLTQAQYDELVNAGTVDANTTYFITDVNNTTASYAAGVTYDNTGSGLSATNVQDAIDEIISSGTNITFTPASSVTVNAISSWKVDRLCGISFDIKGIDLSSGTLTSVGTVDIFPSAVVRSGVTKVADGSHIGIARINTQGDVSILTTGTLSSSLSIAFSFVYKSYT